MSLIIVSSKSAKVVGMVKIDDFDRWANMGTLLSELYTIYKAVF